MRPWKKKKGDPLLCERACMLGCMSAAWNQAETRCLREEGHQGKCSARPCLLGFIDIGRSMLREASCESRIRGPTEYRTGLDAYTRNMTREATRSPAFDK
jgi:hypothetical protein